MSADLQSRSGRLLFSAGAALGIVFVLIGAEPKGVPQLVPAATGLLLAISVDRELPLYPASSRQAGIGGLAVAEIALKADGHLHSLTIIEAPDTAIADAVEKALSRWSFMSRPESEYPYFMVGSIVFAFEPSQGRVLVVGEPSGSQAATGQDDTGIRHIPVSDEESVNALLVKERALLLDVRSRSEFRQAHRQSAVNLPYGEIALRAPDELGTARTVAIDCDTGDTTDCLNAATALRRAGVPTVFVIGGGGAVSLARDSQATISGAIERGIELLERKDFMLFLTELGHRPALDRLLGGGRLSLDELVQRSIATGMFDRLLDLVRAAAGGKTTISGDTAVVVFPEEVAERKGLPFFRVQGRWFIGL